MLLAKWKKLRNRLTEDISEHGKTIRACVLLHNFCIDQGMQVRLPRKVYNKVMQHDVKLTGHGLDEHGRPDVPLIERAAGIKRINLAKWVSDQVSDERS